MDLNLKEFTLDTDLIFKILSSGLQVVLILFITGVIVAVINKLITKFFETRKSSKFKMNQAKADTLSSTAKSVAKYVIYFIAGVSILEVFGVDTKGIIAAAGIGAIAIGFAAQNLVEDIITGFFILFEDQFSVGDYIAVQGIDGIVEELGLRITKVRGFDGSLNIIPNRQIEIVTNKVRGNMRAWVDVGIAYEEDIDKAIEVVTKVAEEYGKENQDIVEGPTVLGVSNLGSSDVVISVIAKTKPMAQWSVERELRKRIKNTFDKEKIEIPYQKRVIYNKRDE
ncbi:mechanosensitive ion channel family protein [Clostridium sp. D2Q-11]|uniref:Mechanosensitive ion channel family protein n=1 Tax=Anaeromonas frigoriresistens TaxID=2683708 RepID=A0A942Z5Y2_9FIRM|nr:mechanosensitive ion channel family protein [Anaeromonas frigoriresistens]MBS4536977.1 mechanosensitive ion channel family protein [Anaeromonas frigoriresistens]